MWACVEICVMSEKTCAACDCKLEAEVISVKIGGKTVEVCCEECAQTLKEAHASTMGQKGSVMRSDRAVGTTRS
jgi:hypothetical protein